MNNPTPLLKCPLPEGWILFGHTLLLDDGDSFPTQPIPDWLWREYHEALKATGLRCAPHLVLLENAGGYGGFFTPGLVALGRLDLEFLAQDVWNRHAWFLTSTFGPIHLKDLRIAVWRYVIAHELGHALQFANGDPSRGIRREVGADEAAGWISCELGLGSVLGEVIAETIGCRQRYCSHPSPVSRVRAFRKGYRDRWWSHEIRFAS